MRLYTIGFTQSSAESFFTRLQRADVKRLIDVRLNNVSQLAGFAKRDDLRYFLRAIGGIEYSHEVLLAPTQAMLDGYKKQRGSWAEYEKQFLTLVASRAIENKFSRESFSEACLLCSEATAKYCHRRLVAEYLQEKWGDVNIVHL